MKLRAWDKEDEEYITWEQLIRIPYNQFFYRQTDPSAPILSILTDPHLTLEQWTGLYDKNGTEIYEGDILRGGLLNEDCTVFYHETNGYYVAQGEHYKVFAHKFWQFEVVGNIHQK